MLDGQEGDRAARLRSRQLGRAVAGCSGATATPRTRGSRCPSCGAGLRRRRCRSSWTCALERRPRRRGRRAGGGAAGDPPGGDRVRRQGRVLGRQADRRRVGGRADPRRRAADDDPLRRLLSLFQDKEVTQQFDVSFTSLTDLTRRVSLLITSRMHRIRPVWLYWDTAPTVIRDVAFDSTTRLPFQEILWKNLRRNDYAVRSTRSPSFEKSDFNKLELNRGRLPRARRQAAGFRADGPAGFPRAAAPPDPRAPAVPGADRRIRRAPRACGAGARLGRAKELVPVFRRRGPGARGPPVSRVRIPRAGVHGPGLSGGGGVVADVFLSYKREDRDRAQRVERALTAQGWDVFWDHELLPSTVPFRVALAQELERARCVLVLWSRRSVESEWVLDEATQGKDSRKLVCARIDDVKMPLGFRQLQAADLIEWNGDAQADAFQQLVLGIAKLVPGLPSPNGRSRPTRPPPPPLPPPPPPKVQRQRGAAPDPAARGRFPAQPRGNPARRLAHAGEPRRRRRAIPSPRRSAGSRGT